MKKGMMISCEDATELVIKKSQEKLSFWNKFRLAFHLAMCKFCSLFETQNKIIDSIASKMDDGPVPEKMTDSSKERILQEISK